MKTVYILVECYQYGAEKVLAVFDTYEKAKDYMDSLHQDSFFTILTAQVQ